MHWSRSHASSAAINELLPPLADPYSGEPAYKNAPVCVVPAEPIWQGYFLSETPVDIEGVEYWVKVRGSDCFAYHLADTRCDVQPNELWQSLVHTDYTSALIDEEQGSYRLLAFSDDGRLMNALMVDRRAAYTPPLWMQSGFQKSQHSIAEQMWLLSPSAPRGQQKHRTVCSCNRVDEGAIVQLVMAGAETTDQITARCRAGGNCGSCLPEIQQLLSKHKPSRQRESS